MNIPDNQAAFTESELQTSFQRRFTKGLPFDANYTWGKALSDVTGFSQEGAQGWSNADPTRIRQIDYGIAENDIQNRFAISLNYEVQHGKNFTGFKKTLLAGHHVNTITVCQSGKPSASSMAAAAPATPSTPPARPSPSATGATARNNGGNDRPNLIGDARGPKTDAQFFNTAAFAPQPVGTIGSEKRNSLFGPDFRHVDVSLFKDFTVTERLSVQFRAEALDVTNTPSFIINQGSGNAQLGNSAFGTVTNFDPNYNPRQLQFALKAQP